MHRSLTEIAGTLALALLLSAHAASAQISLGTDPRIDPADFRITVFATDLSYPTSMQELEDGSLLVLTNVPTNGLFDSTGQLVRLVDTDGDGVANGAPQVVFAGLPGIATSVRKLGDLVFVSSRELDNETISVLRTGAQPADVYTLEGTIDFLWPGSAIIQNHRNVALAVRDHGGSGGDVDLFFNAGSESNSDPTTVTFEGTGLLSGVSGATAMSADSIYWVTIDDSGASPTAATLLQVATGLRNAAGIGFSPATGDLYFQDNGIDPATGVSQSADELNRIAVGSVGGAIEDFGFPSDYVEYRTGTVATALSVQPLVAFQPIPDPFTGAMSEGPVELAFAPAGFPAALRDGLFVGFHGRFNNNGVLNDENPIVYVDPATGEYIHFVPNTDPGIGHPNGLLATADSLFVADLAANTSLFGNSVSGTIHQIRANPAPIPVLSPLAAACLSLTLLTGGWRGSRRLRS